MKGHVGVVGLFQNSCASFRAKTRARTREALHPPGSTLQVRGRPCKPPAGGGRHWNREYAYFIVMWCLRCFCLWSYGFFVEQLANERRGMCFLPYSYLDATRRFSIIKCDSFFMSLIHNISLRFFSMTTYNF